MKCKRWDRDFKPPFRSIARFMTLLASLMTKKQTFSRIALYVRDFSSLYDTRKACQKYDETTISLGDECKRY
jgi:hypothetical protein